MKIVISTMENIENAEQIGEKLVEERIAACVNIIQKVESIYRWKGNIEKEDEVLLVIKTTEENVDKIKPRIRELHNYETPEILIIPVNDVSSDYSEWIEKNCK